jgi:glutathione S-transferase
MDSTLILEYAEAMARPRSLMPRGRDTLQRDLRLIGLALVACEKSVQIIYERSLRPPEKLYEPWVTRITGQLLAAYETLEQELTRRPLASSSSTIGQAGITTAVAWHFTQQTLPDVVPVRSCPALATFSAKAEALPEFMAAPHGDSIFRARD